MVGAGCAITNVAPLGSFMLSGGKKVVECKKWYWKKTGSTLDGIVLLYLIIIFRSIIQAIITFYHIFSSSYLNMNIQSVFSQNCKVAQEVAFLFRAITS